MKLPLHIARKIRQLTGAQASLPASSMQHAAVTKMLEDGFLGQKQTGKSRKVLFIADQTAIAGYLHNHFGISDLDDYIDKQDEALMRSEAIILSGNSKLTTIRTFKGFLVNSLYNLETTLHNRPFTLSPTPGTYTYIYDYEAFLPSSTITVVGIENAENFRRLKEQEYLFNPLQALFVSRYPQSNDLVKWLRSIPNPYLHFGDLDFEGIKIYLNEYKKHLGARATFFVPPGLEALLVKYGNRDLFNRQYLHRPAVSDVEPELQPLVHLFLKHGKVLEQEIFIHGHS